MKLKELPGSLYHTTLLRLRRPRVQADRLPVVVSLTSIPSRLRAVRLTIRSILAQTHQPECVVLWLNREWRTMLPASLTALRSEVFRIEYCEGTSSYRKLIPALREYPDRPIVTVDDDVLYPPSWLRTLHSGHVRHPKAVVCQYARRIRRRDGVLLPYTKWTFLRSEEACDRSLLPIGYGGTLYPVGTFSGEVFNARAYRALAPRADDLWFKAMGALNGATVLTLAEFARPIPLLGTQAVALKKTNVEADENRVQWQGLCDAYPPLNEIAVS